jgi:hypothetical protein
MHGETMKLITPNMLGLRTPEYFDKYYPLEKC